MELSRTRLRMPVLAIGAKKANGELLAQQVRIVATVVVFKDSGHWVLEEQPRETADALMKFL